jgi:hypothetical protein
MNSNLTGLLVQALTLWTALGAALVSYSQTNSLGRIGASVWRVGFIEQRALAESSGLAASPRYPGVFWSHNDNDYPGFLFAIDRQGHHLGAFELKGARLIDWEATAFDEAGSLYLADIGTNGIVRSHSAIHRVAEPHAPDRWGPLPVLQTWLIRFPGVREDCESFFVAGGYGYLIGKSPLRGRVSFYRFSLSDPSESILLERIGEIPAPGSVDDATLSADRQRLALITTKGLVVIYIDGDPLSAVSAPRRLIPFESSVLEGAAFVSDGVLVTGETPDVFLFTGSVVSGAPLIARELLDQSAFAGDSIVFSIEASGAGDLRYEWRFNGELLPGETGPSLSLANLTPANSGVYEATVLNGAGSAKSSASLSVTERRFDLRITEIMSSELPGSAPTADWWELTSFDTQEIDLGGWRFNDSIGGLADAYVIPSGVTIAPGESIVFVEDLTPDEFRAWWGAENFTPATKIYTYAGSALSFRATGDSLRLWDNKTGDDNAVFTRADFGAAQFGVSFGYDPRTEVFGANSELGVDGAFRAATGADIGSPGRIRGIVLEGSVTAGTFELKVRDLPGTPFILESSDNLASPQWRYEGEVEAPVVRPIQPNSARFFRLRKP